MVERGTRFWYDQDLIHALQTLSVTGYEATETDDDLVEISLEVEFDPVHTARLLEERAEYLDVASNEPQTVDDVVAQLVTEIDTALDIQYNTVGISTADNGVYEKINDQQWSKSEDETVYSEYSELLYEVTGRDIDYDKETPSIPGLRKPFLKAVTESPDHTLPAQGAVREILSQHLKQLRHENQSRGAVSALKNRLESEGVNPRSAMRVAQNMDDLLIEDETLAEQQSSHPSD